MLFTMDIAFYDGMDEKLSSVTYILEAEDVSQAYDLTDQWVYANEADLPEHHDFLVSLENVSKSLDIPQDV